MERRKEEGEGAAPCIVAILPVLCLSPSHVGIFSRFYFSPESSAVFSALLQSSQIQIACASHLSFLNKTFNNLKNNSIFNIPFTYFQIDFLKVKNCMIFPDLLKWT